MRVVPCSHVGIGPVVSLLFGCLVGWVFGLLVCMFVFLFCFISVLSFVIIFPRVMRYNKQPPARAEKQIATTRLTT